MLGNFPTLPLNKLADLSLAEKLRSISTELFMIRKVSILFILSLLSACGRVDFNEAVMLEKHGMPAKAAGTYEVFAKKNPKDLKAPQALFNVARIYSHIFYLCHKSKPLYERLVRDYPDFPFLSQAKKNIFMCPDYYPLGASYKWVYGDSQTGGKNMRQSVRLISSNNAAFMIETSFYAGRKFVQKILNIYSFSDSEIIRKEKDFSTIVLKYPIVKNKKWGLENKKISYEIADIGLEVKVKAGVFLNCVKVKEREKNSASWVYVYYAPWVGKILTTVAGQGFENRVEELISYEK